MKKFFLFSILFFSITIARAQYFKLDWAVGIGSTDLDYSSSVAVDEKGNVYACGIFNGTVDFDPGPGVYKLSSLGSEDMFITKFDESGNFKWAVSFGGSSDDYCWSITTGATGNVLATGQFYDTVDFDPGAGTENLYSAGSSDMFIVSLDSLGKFEWVKQIGGLSQQSAHSITTDRSGNVYTCGTFSGPTDFDPGTATHMLYTSSAFSPACAFVLKLNPSGNFVWAKQFIASSGSGGACLRVDSKQNIYSVGSFRGNIDMDPGAGTHSLTSAGNTDFYISKLDSSGNFIWGKRIGGKLGDAANSFTLDDGDNIYLTGIYQDTVDFDPGFWEYKLSAPFQSAYVLKLDQSGAFEWAKTFEGCNGLSICKGSSGNIYTTGIFIYDCDFDPGPGKKMLYRKSSVLADMFLSGLDSAGNYVLATSLSSYGGLTGRAIASDKLGHLFVAGDYRDSLDFDPSGGSTFLKSNGISDAFMIKLDECKAYSSSFSITTCKPYVLNSKLFSSSGVYTEIFNTAKGCDSIVTMDLDLVNINPVITSYGLTMGIGTTFGATYQWVNCPSYTPIPGANSRIYTAPSTGSYSVIVTLADCSDTAKCFTPLPLNIERPEIKAVPVSILPNPAKDKISIQSPTLEGGSIYMFNMLGQVMYFSNQLTGNDVVDISSFASGMYFIKTIDKQQQQNQQRVIKE